MTLRYLELFSRTFLTMPIDYSKWDKIELSDDSDIEVHPNVDKNSFVRWKQRDIHEKRQQRNIEIKSILVQLTMYAKLNARVDYLLKELSPQELLNNTEVMLKVNGHFDKLEKFDYEKLIADKGDTLRKGLRDLKFDPEEIENTPPYNEMIEDLFIQIRQDHPDASDPEKLVTYLKEHRNKIDDVLSKQTIRLDDLLNQKANLISSDDIHTGFDRSFLNKGKLENDEPVVANPPPQTTSKTTSTTSSQLTSVPSTKPASTSSPSTAPQSTSTAVASSTSSPEEPDLTLLPATEAFGKITSVADSDAFLTRNPLICTEQQKDALMMSAFDYQLAGNTAGAKQAIHQALLLQYVAQLAGPRPSRDLIVRAAKLFCSKVGEDSPARAGFMQDVQSTLEHIKKRCEFIQSEHEQQGEAQIQLKSLDDSVELLVNIPEEGTKEYEVFSTKLSPELQAAVKTGSLDEVNKVLGSMKVEDAEKVLEVFNECGVIGINEYFEDENDFKELQEQYKNAEIHDVQEEQENQETQTVPENAFDTTDVVD